MYRFDSFNGVRLPIYNTETEHTGGVVASTLTRTINGWFDLRGAKQAFPDPATFTMRGLYTTQDFSSTEGYLRTHTGDRLIVSTGNPLLVVARSTGNVREQIEALRQLIGVRADLVRVPMAGNPSAAQSITARLLSVRQNNSKRLPLGVVEVEALFEAIDPYWNGASKSATGLTMTAIVEGNAPVRNARLVVTGTTASTRITGNSIDLSFNGSGQTLTLQGLTVSHTVTWNAGHTVDTLIELQPGTNVIRVVGASGATLTWNDKWQ